MAHRLRLHNLAAALVPSDAASAAKTAPPAALGKGGAADLTIGVCHAAYPCVPVLQRKLAHITSVFQEWNKEDMLPRMSEVDVLCVSGAWDNKFLDNAPNLKSEASPRTLARVQLAPNACVANRDWLSRYIQSIGVGYNQFPLEELKKRGIVLCNAVGVNLPSHKMTLHGRVARGVPAMLLTCVLVD